MRRMKTAFLSCAAVVAAALLATPLAMATGGSSSGSTGPTAPPLPPPDTCVAGVYTVKVKRGPVFVPCSYGQCTEMEYEVSGGSYRPDHVAILQGVGVQYITGGAASGNKFYAPCDGDPLTGVGKLSCHQQAAKINPSSSVQNFVIGLAGQRKASPTTVVVKKSSTTKSCTILGMGLEGVASPFQAATAAECHNFKGCIACFYKDATGEIVNAELDPSSKPGCSAVATHTIDKLKLELDGVDLGSGQIGEGYVSSGTNSCTTRVIGGRVYTWGDPCP